VAATEIQDIVKEIVETAEELKPPQKPKKRWKRFVFWMVFIVAVGGAFAYTLVNDLTGAGSPSGMPELLSRYWWFLLFAIAAVFVCFLCRAFVYAIMMHLFTGKKRLRLCMSVTMLGKFYDSVTPLGTGSQPFQIHHLQKNNTPDGVAIALPIMEYTINRFSFVLISIAAIILNAANVFGDNVGMNTAIYVAAIIGIVLNFGFPMLLIISLFSKKACRKLTRLFVTVAKCLRLTKDPCRLYKKIMSKLDANISCMKMFVKRKRLFFCFALSIGGRLAMASVGYFVLKAFGFGTLHGWGWAEIVVLNILIANSVTFIPTPGNSGAADLSFYWVFNSVLLASTGVASGAVATLVWRGISYYSFILIGFVLVMVIASKRKKMARANP